MVIFFFEVEKPELSVCTTSRRIFVGSTTLHVYFATTFAFSGGGVTLKYEKNRQK